MRSSAVRALALGGALAIAIGQGQGQLPSSTPKGLPIAKRYMGVNIGSGSFAGQNRPGRYGYDYAYPTTTEAAPFLAVGMNAVRVPLLWERVQYAPDAPVEKAELKRLDATIAALRGFQLIILDVHNYAAYRGTPLDNAALPHDALANLWSQLAHHFKSNNHVAFGIMNEPNGISPYVWRGFAEDTLRSIRATGARNLVLIPGANWDGAHSWLQGGGASNGAAFNDFHDPTANMAFEMHQYADRDSSGTHWTCVSPNEAAGRLTEATQWLRSHKQRGFLGEFGSSADLNCLNSLDGMLRAVSDASDVWLGWTYWSAGSRWGAYPMSVQPDGHGSKPQMAVLERFISH